MKVYAKTKHKSLVMFIIGKDKISKGMNIVGSHIDSPRLDIKPNPLYEETNLSFLKTHYYGGIKKYQWVSTPLALHGVIIDKDNNKINITIGEDKDDPVFFITDLLIHLSKDQLQKKLGEAITGEGLNILVGNQPIGDDEIKEKVKLNVLNILFEKYNITEKDFLTAELQAVPAGKARDVGFDRSLISAYGQDDRICAFAGLKAILDIESPQKTVVKLFTDKEEVGSNGNTGAHSDFFEKTLMELINRQEGGDYLLVKEALSQTKVLSADVGVGYDPNYPEVSDKKNSAMIGNGVQLIKYTGSKGKYSCNDANAEFIGEVKNIFDKHEITWQVGELGKVDQGGGGTIAFILANKGAEVVDCGVPVLSMHSPNEIVSKADLYMTYRAYRAFLEEA
jgi:aspartyl aminopeptidase